MVSHSLHFDQSLLPKEASLIGGGHGGMEDMGGMEKEGIRMSV